MPTITIRLDNDLLEKINQSKDDKTVSTYCKNIISEYLNSGVHDVHNSQEIDFLKTELQHKNDMLKMCTERVQDLQNSLGYLQLEFSRLNSKILLPESTKRWWYFWKK